MIDHSHISRLILISEFAATFCAVLLTVLVFVAHKRMQKSPRWVHAAWLVTCLELASAYVVSAIVMMTVLRAQSSSPRPLVADQFEISTVYVDPGILPRLLPLGGIVATWSVLVMRRRAATPASRS